jgi:hypothetical protein
MYVSSHYVVREKELLFFGFILCVLRTVSTLMFSGVRKGMLNSRHLGFVSLLELMVDLKNKQESLSSWQQKYL